MQKYKTLRMVALIVAVAAPLVLVAPALAADGDIVKTQDFIKNIIKVAAGFAGLVATAFFVVGGFGYSADAARGLSARSLIAVRAVRHSSRLASSSPGGTPPGYRADHRSSTYSGHARAAVAR